MASYDIEEVTLAGMRGLKSDTKNIILSFCISFAVTYAAIVIIQGLSG